VPKARLPAEWEPQAGVMLTWPHEDTDWGDRLPVVYPVFAAIGSAISAHEILLSVCQSTAHAARVRQLLRERGAAVDRLRFCIAPSDDSWARDHGPLTTVAGGRALLNDFIFNGWGGKFAGARDSAISGTLQAQRVFPATEMHRREFVLEGGAIETDGAGTLLARRSSVITDTRNPGLRQADVERLLGDYLGFDRFLWLDHGDVSGDDTDGHIDTLARFAAPDTIVYATAPANDADHPGLDAMEGQLRGLRTRSGSPYRLLPLPFPGVHLDRDGRRLPATYANFLLINDAVLLPTYAVAEDAEAIAVLSGAFPGRDVIPVDCRDIIEQNGSLHCLTMQFPAQVELRDSLEFTTA